MSDNLLAFTAAPLFLLIVFLAAAIVISLLIGRAAERKGRSKLAFFWISFLLFPLGAIIMGIIVATLAPPESTTNPPRPPAG
jgi:MFS family permease